VIHAEVSYYEPDSPQAQFVKQGRPSYWSCVDGVLGIGELLREEGLASLAVVPIRSCGEVIAVLNLASRVNRKISQITRNIIEAIATQTGGVISRLRMDEALKMERQNLAETNTALKVLLQGRDRDRGEIEENLLSNIQKLAVPCMEKLKKTALTPDQRQLVDLLHIHLKEATSPFVNTLARRFANLTSTEVRVAELIKIGRTSKEIAEVLGTSENAIVFHRNNVRAKLGLRSRKVNLASYLASLGK
jgi:DNA-binding CsgD family transcriptional regulator